MNNPRLQAVVKLTKLFKTKLSLSTLLNAQDHPLTKEICYGVMRHYYKLDTTLNYLLKKPPSKTEIYVVLLTGIYQLQYLNAPDYAVVTESVNILNALKMPWAKGLVNGVLRNFCRQKDSLNDKTNQDCPFNHPQWFIDKVKIYYPNEWQDILKANDAHPPMTLRVNQQKISKDAYLEKLQKHNIQARSLNKGIELITPVNVNDLPGFYEGEVSVQDEASQQVTTLLQLEPNLSLLDACSAPGGKLCHILETQPNLKKCLAIELDALRIEKIKQNLARLNLSADIITADASESSWWDGTPFDRILLDVPCSATGVIRRHPDIKILRTPKDIEAIVKLQLQLLNNLWNMLKVNGILVYTTCSILVEENQQQIANFLKIHPDARAEKFSLPWGESKEFGYQVLPHEHHTDGFFYSVLKKTK